VIVFQHLQTPDQPVILRVADLGLIENVVLVLVMVDRFAQMFRFFAGIGW
jgi:hypothetical protein